VLYGNEESPAHVYENPGRKILIRTATGIVVKFLVVGIINCYKRQRSFSFKKGNLFYDFKYFYCASLFFLFRRPGPAPDTRTQEIFKYVFPQGHPLCSGFLKFFVVITFACGAQDKIGNL